MFSSTASRVIAVHLARCIYDSYFIRTIEPYFKKTTFNKWRVYVEYLHGTNVKKPSTEPKEVGRGV